MSQWVEFSFRHFELVTIGVGIIVLLLGLEVYRRIRGSQPLSPMQAVLRMNRDDIAVLDIREMHYFAKGHLSGARHVPLAQLPIYLKKLTTQTPILLVAEQGEPPYKINQLLRIQGFKQLYYLEGGVRAWQQANLPLVQ